MKTASGHEKDHKEISEKGGKTEVTMHKYEKHGYGRKGEQLWLEQVLATASSWWVQRHGVQASPATWLILLSQA